MTKDVEKGFLLDLDKPEYDDLFITSTDERELWQRDAMYSLVDKLKINLTAAKKYGKQREKDRKKTNLSHNSIFLTGERGSGKTVFLRNVEPIWKNKNKQDLENYIGFLDVIDPTMLMNNDSFANVVVAEIYRKVEEHNSDNNVSSTDRAAFYNALKSLSDSLGKQDEFNGHSGVDKILRYNSGIQVEKNFHRYVEEAIKILSCSALVLPIDDVDMSLQKAHEVIDDVRRLLGCPYIIPIVSGDVALYEQMINVDFDDRAYKRDSSSSLKESGAELAKILSDEYLKKVFPAQMRLPLNSIVRVMYSLNVREDAEEREVAQYIEHFYNKFYFLLHNSQKSNELPIPETSRELTQLVRSFSLGNLEEKGNYNLWSTFCSFCESKKDADGYVNALSYLIADSRRNADDFSLRELPVFNPLLQLNRTYSWAEKDIYLTQTEASDRISTAENSKFIEQKILGSDRTLTSMPPYDYHNRRFYISKDTIKDESNKNQYLLDIYTSSNYYSTLANTTPIVFVGRAFELVVLSFISEGINLKSQIQQIMNDTPLHSVFALNSTKHIGTSISDDDSMMREENIEFARDEDTGIWLSIAINDWKATHSELFDQIDNLELLPIFAKIFNQVFTQVSLLKSKLEHGNYQDEHLSDFACRFEYIFKNSALMQMNDVKVILANTAQTYVYETLRNNEIFSKVDRTIERNTKYIESSEHCNAKWANLFINALSTHPIFKINVSVNNNKAVRKQSYLLDWRDSKQTVGQFINDFQMIMDKAITSSKSFSGKNSFSKSDFINWFNNDYSEALKMSQRIVKIIDLRPELEPKKSTNAGKALDVMRHYVYTS